MRLVVYDVDVKERDNSKLKLGQQDFLGGSTTHREGAHGWWER